MKQGTPLNTVVRTLVLPTPQSLDEILLIGKLVEAGGGTTFGLGEQSHTKKWFSQVMEKTSVGSFATAQLLRRPGDEKWALAAKQYG